jgi:hypothetical protein
MKETHVAKIIFLWIIIIAVNLAYFSQHTNEQSSFYNFGPNENLIILNIHIDTNVKYTIVVIYSIVNNIIRNLNTNILRPWITHNIQDNTDEAKIRKSTLNYLHAYEINTIYTIYQWFDFLIYIHLILTQIDLFLIESTSDVLIVTIITYVWFLPHRKPQITTTSENVEANEPLLNIIIGDQGFINLHPKIVG